MHIFLQWLKIEFRKYFIFKDIHWLITKFHSVKIYFSVFYIYGSIISFDYFYYFLFLYIFPIIYFGAYSFKY